MSGTESTPNKAQWVQEAEDRGYKEALLDVYCFLTGNEQVLDYPERCRMIESMVIQVNKVTHRLTEVG